MVELKLANSLIRRILIVTRSAINIITWHYLNRLKHPRRKTVPLIHPILGFRGQEVNPTGMIRLLIRFGEKSKAQNLEVDFLVVDVLTACTLILGRPTLHPVKVIVASYFLQLQYEADDGSVRKIQGDQLQLGSATLSASDRWWNTRADADLDLLSHHPQIKSRGLRFLPPLKPWSSIP